MEFVVSYDLRAPDFGAPAREIYAATLDQCAWADSIGFDEKRAVFARAVGGVAVPLKIEARRFSRPTF